MTKIRLTFLLSLAASMHGQTPLIDLPEITVYSSHVAIQQPVGVYTMPVSALRFEPLVDVQSRNFAEAQADVVLRGGIFENTGFRVGTVALFDPQTGHYFAEIPVAPAMLGTPKILTGSANAVRGWNANVGTIAYEWRRIRTAGTATIALGDYDTQRAEIYQGVLTDTELFGRKVAFDADLAHSESDGSLKFSEHRFTRFAGRLQLADELSQTDLFYGYQSKFFGWPNLYTPFANVYESENIQTNLVILNHRNELGGGDYVSVGGYYRRNKDNYVFNRPDAGAYNPAFAVGPAFHTTWVYGAGYEARFTEGNIVWNLDAHYISDELKSSSLLFGRYRTRDHYKLAVAPERTWVLAGDRTLIVVAGITYDDTNRNGSAVSPVTRVSLRENASATGIYETYFSYSKSTQTPTYFALNSRQSAGLFRGNPDLDREIAHNLEVGLQGAWGKWTADLAVFFRRDDRLVDWIYSTSLPNARAANAVDIETFGLESVARYASKHVDLVFGYSALKKNADYGTVNVNASFYALNYPKHRLTAAAIVRLGGGWEVRSDNEARLQAENALRRSDDEALLSSLALYFTPEAWRGLRFSLEVENLWNSDFQEVPAVPAARRQMAIGATYSW